MTDEQATLRTVHYLRMVEHWGKAWADEHAFANRRWPADDKDWRQTGHGAPWDANVEMARFHLRLARKIVTAVGLK